METICMKYLILFSGKNEKNVINLPSAELVKRVVNVKPTTLHIQINETGTKLSCLLKHKKF